MGDWDFVPNNDEATKMLAELRAKLAAAEAKSEQRREVLREREFDYWSFTMRTINCSQCGATPGEEHTNDCAWKRAMEDA